MTATQYRAALDKLGLSQPAAARLLGASDSTSKRWALGTRRVHPAAAILLTLLIDGTVSANQIERAGRRKTNVQ